MGGIFGGTTPQETAVMDLHDARCSDQAIARELGLPIDRVRKIVGTYREGRADNFAGPVAKASAQLRDAVLRLQARG